MTDTSAAQLYHQFVAVIDKAMAEQDIFAVPDAAVAAGMTGEASPKGISYRANYSYADADGATVAVHARYWDQSKSFSTRPDMHVMSVTLEHGSTKLHHEKRYEQ